MGKICGKRTKAETKQLGVREAGKQGGGWEHWGKKTKTKKEGMLFVGWKLRKDQKDTQKSSLSLVIKK